MTTTRWEKFRLLMWKNWLLQIRHKSQTIAEILIPVVFSGLLVFIRANVKPTEFTNAFIYDALNVDNFTETRENITYNPTICYAPSNPVLAKFMERIGDETNLEVIPLNTSESLENRMLSHYDFVGIDFGNHFANLIKIPDTLNYAFRFPGKLRHTKLKEFLSTWETNSMAKSSISGARNYDDPTGGPGYYIERFIHLQHEVFNSFIEHLKNQKSVNVPAIHLRRFPYPPFTQDQLMHGLGMVASLIFLMCFAYPCVNIVKFITTEKEKQLKEAMKIMGLANWLHWTAWMVKCLMFMMITITCMLLMLTFPWIPGQNLAVLAYSSRLAVWLFLFVYSLSTITFCFMLSIFFAKANTASSVAGMLWFVTYTPFMFIYQMLATIGFRPQIVSCLFSNAAMGLGVKIIIQKETNGEGLQFSNFFEPTVKGDQFCFGHVMIMLVMDTILYLMITLFVEMLLTSNSWSFGKERDEESYVSHESQDNFQKDPKGKEAGIKIRDLRKKYANKKIAVQGLTLNMYEDQITVLLGHNGAGKTTTMSMLTGMMEPTSGTALINGKDIQTEMDQVRGSLGLCPQYDILFDELTVREHIVFFCRLKGVPKDMVEEEVEKYVLLLELEKKINNQSHTLSGGMRRKLSVGVALCGGSKVVLFDEPTSGIDPSARRALWDLLLQEKKGRTILLSTHFMDEADILGDRIAIMAEGELKAVGSSFFLKKKFGVGYRLVCVKEADCNTAAVTDLLRQYIPSVDIKTNIGSELSYELKDENIEVFQDMLEDLEANAEKLSLLNYGLSLTTMEEVFMKVGSDYKNNANDDEMYTGSDGSLDNLETHLQTGVLLFLNQLLALFKKRYYNLIRNWQMFLIQNLIPIIFLSLTIFIVRTWHGNKDLPALELNIKKYPRAVTLLQNSAANLTIFDNYRQIIEKDSKTSALDVSGKNMIEYFLNISKEMQPTVNTHYIIGASINEKNVTAWFNNQPFHSAPIALNTVHNAILGALFGKNVSLNVTNKPLPFRPETKMAMLHRGNNLGFQLALNLSFAMAFVAAFYVIAYVKERASKAKLLQFVSGVNIFAYWFTAFIWDYMTFMVTTCVTLGTLFAYQQSGWTTAAESGRAFAILMCFGFSMLPYTYLASTKFTIPATGFTRMSIFFIFTGIGMFCVIFVLRYDQFDLKKLTDTLTDYLLVFPHFALSDAFSNVNYVNVVKKLNEGRCKKMSHGDPLYTKVCDVNYFSYDKPGVGRHLVYMMSSGSVLLVLLLIIELRVFKYIKEKIGQIFGVCSLRNIFKRKKPGYRPMSIYTDSDVYDEVERVTMLPPEKYKDHNLILKDVIKYYDRFLAVNQLNVAIDPYECFGLLGINGAGKTTTFKMLIGDEKMSSGDSFVQGISLKRDTKGVHKRIGYCPQFDALIDDLTGRETLDFFCMLRGVRRADIERVSNTLANELNFMQHIDKLVREYSGGNKRKLSTAVALLGNPSVIFLDEPTTGMDPGAKRHLWSAICKVRNQGRSIVLTSHSMEECEALCTRIAIMVSGEFRCLGSVQHLKSKFSKGFILTITVKCLEETNIRNSVGNRRSFMVVDSLDATNLRSIKNYIENTFDAPELKEEFQGLLTYHIGTTDMKWSKLFGVMENAKKKYPIEDYSIGQTSLEQVFLGFAKMQKSDD